MINVTEFNRFQLHARLSDFGALVGSIWITPPNELSVEIKPIHSPTLQKYDFALHPQFGVVKILSDDREWIGKSPLCERLEQELRHYADEL